MCSDTRQCQWPNLAYVIVVAWWLDGAVALAIAAWAVIEGRRACAGKSCSCTSQAGACC
jgi:hypothetical protein